MLEQDNAEQDRDKDCLTVCAYINDGQDTSRLQESTDLLKNVFTSIHRRFVKCVPMVHTMNDLQMDE